MQCLNHPLGELIDCKKRNQDSVVVGLNGSEGIFRIGSFVVLLVWIYYSSIILYLGAEFTKHYALKYGEAIHPNDYAVTTKQVEIETGHDTVQQAQKK